MKFNNGDIGIIEHTFDDNLDGVIVRIVGIASQMYPVDGDFAYFYIIERVDNQMFTQTYEFGNEVVEFKCIQLSEYCITPVS